MRQPLKQRGRTAPRRRPDPDYRPPPLLRRLRVGSMAVLALSAVVLLYVVYWFFAASMLRDGVTEWVEARRAEGFTVRDSGMEIDGFPLHLRATIEQPALAAPGAGSPTGSSPGSSWSWEGERAILELRPWNLGRFMVRLPGAHRIDFTDHGETVTYSGTARELTVELEAGGDWPRSIALAVSDLAFSTAGEAGALSLRRGNLEARRPTEDGGEREDVTLELFLAAEDLRLPAALKLPMGRHVSMLSMEAAVIKDIAQGPLVESLIAWRDAGGTVEVPRLEIEYGPLGLRGNGTIALDGDMQPIGAFTVKVVGFFETVDRLLEAGLMRARDAVTAKIVLGALAQRPADGGPPTLNLPLTLQDLRLYAGPVKLAEIEPIIWELPGTEEAPDSLQ